MHSYVKAPVLLTILLFISSIAKAQFKSSPGLTADIQRVIGDYPNRFANLTGELIIQNPQSADYRCNFKINGAEESTVTQYSGDSILTSSWQALFITTDNFETAKRKFRALFSELNGITTGAMHLKGTFETPREEMKFTSVRFSLSPAEEPMKKLVVELLMEAQGMDWTVRVLAYDRERQATAQ